ncbi:MAG TPA: ATP-binding protein [candidate division Zixibacteria bacterium]|jgi:signal transduction histidine kinase
MHLTLRVKFILVAGSVSIIALGSALVALSYQLERDLVRQIAEQLISAESTFTEWRRESQEYLSAEARIVANDPRFFAAVAESDPNTAIPVARQFQRLSGSQLFLVCDARGDKLAHLDSQEGVLSLDWPDSIPPKGTYLRLDDGLYLLSSQAVMVGSETMGYVALGRRVDAGLAASMGRVAGADVIFHDDALVFGSTLADPRSNKLIAEIRAQSSEYAESGSAQTVTVEGERFLFRSGLLHANAPARYAILMSLDQRLKAPVADLRATMLWLGTLALALAVAVSLTVARRVTARVPQLVAAVEAVARGDYGHEVTHKGHDEFRMVADAVDSMRHELAAQMEAIRKANAEKLDAERLAVIGKMASSIIHDFKTPMQVIRGVLDLTTDREMPADKRARYAAMVHFELERMMGMTQDLLDFARGETRMARRPTNVDAFLAEAVDAWNHIAESRGIKIEFSGQADTIAGIDKDKIRRALDNIVSNALDVLTEGGVISIRSRANGGVAQISIADCGPGIPAELHQRIFEPFATFGKTKGTGLGLAVAKKAVDDHGGTIRVESEAGEGTTFIIALPLATNGKTAERETQHAESGVSENEQVAA